MGLRKKTENVKIACARKFFDAINHRVDPENVKYDVVDSFGKLMGIVSVETASSSGERC